jgi:HEAT repeat protein
MNNTLFVNNASNAVVSLFNRLRSGILARITWKAHCHVPDLIKDLKDEQGEVRYLAAWMLSKMGSEAKIAAPALIEALKDERERFVVLPLKFCRVWVMKLKFLFLF